MAERKSMNTKPLGHNCYCCKHYKANRCYMPGDTKLGKCLKTNHIIYDDMEYKECCEKKKPYRYYTTNILKK